MTKNYILRLFGVLITAASILPATAQEVKPMPPVVVTSA